MLWINVFYIFMILISILKPEHHPTFEWKVLFSRNWEVGDTRFYKMLLYSQEIQNTNRIFDPDYDNSVRSQNALGMTKLGLKLKWGARFNQANSWSQEIEKNSRKEEKQWMLMENLPITHCDRWIVRTESRGSEFRETTQAIMTGIL